MEEKFIIHHHKECCLLSNKKNLRFKKCDCSNDFMKKREIDSVLLYIENNIEITITPKNISTKLGYSTGHFLRLFKKYLGVTLGQYVREIRLDKATKLLLTTDQPISIIASSVGFTHKQLHHSFKQKIQLSPSEFRKKYAKKSSEPL
ncbi:MAG: AraC family transcriptional regulator [Streptococcaceae bacterium]|jgi:transcriptional regulator GlxA family with amidase domain|nr:AraC family transcriptional regulator [Streptococcaceae bacterium]